MTTNVQKLEALFKNTFTKADGAWQNGFIEKTFDKADGAYQNAILARILSAVTDSRTATTALSGKVDALSSLLQAREDGATLDAEAVAAQIAELLPKQDAGAIVDALARRLAPEVKG